jgi:hypothetical protein
MEELEEIFSIMWSDLVCRFGVEPDVTAKFLKRLKSWELETDEMGVRILIRSSKLAFTEYKFNLDAVCFMDKVLKGSRCGL